MVMLCQKKKTCDLTWTNIQLTPYWEKAQLEKMLPSTIAQFCRVRTMCSCKHQPPADDLWVVGEIHLVPVICKKSTLRFGQSKHAKKSDMWLFHAHYNVCFMFYSNTHGNLLLNHLTLWESSSASLLFFLSECFLRFLCFLCFLCRCFLWLDFGDCGWFTGVVRDWEVIVSSLGSLKQIYFCNIWFQNYSFSPGLEMFWSGGGARAAVTHAS